MPSSEVFGKFKRGALHSGSKSGPVVKNRAQAIAIYESERRAEAANGGTYPERRGKKRKAKRSRSSRMSGGTSPIHQAMRGTR